MGDGGIERTASKPRLIFFYAALFAAVGTVIVVALAAGESQEPQPPIAGGYDLERSDPCLGEQFDIKQSGQFVNLENPEQTLSGSLRFERDMLSGEVSCVDGSSADLEARIVDGQITGTVAGREISAVLERDPPPPGSQRPLIPDEVAGEYLLSPRSECLGGEVALEEAEGEGALEVLIDEQSHGELHYGEGLLEGTAECSSGDEVEVTGEAADRSILLTLEPIPASAEAGGEDGDTVSQPPEVAAERITATKQREFGETLAVFFIAIAVVMVVARLFGALAVRVGQPRVMGEVVAGIVLGPTLFGAIAPDLQALVFPKDVIPLIGVVANLGLIFYMFIVGLELDPAQLRGRISQAAAISNASVAIPMALGVAVAVPIYELLAPEGKFASFALFMGVAMSITAFPVLARILVERRMLKRPVGALAMASAAIDDVTAWFLIALATVIAVAGSSNEVVETIALAIGFCLVMFLAVRPLIGRVSTAYDEAGRVPGGWIAVIFAGVLLSAYATETIGIALIFGAFVMGLVMPRHAELTEDVTGRIEDFVVTLLLPLFFAFTGLRTNVGLLDRPELWLIAGILLTVAIVGKFAGAMIAARVVGLGWRASGVLGTLMNTRGLTELIVLNLALEKGVISEALFASLVIMALVTTFMAGPLLRLIDPRNEFGAPLEEEFAQARDESESDHPGLAVPEQSILIAPQTNAGLAQLLALAQPLARSAPPRELIVARLVRPPRGAAAGVRPGVQTENKLLREASEEITLARDHLIASGVAARGVTFISSDPGSDLSRVAQREDVDLLLIDGRRPLLGEGVPRGEVGAALEQAPCDVAVLVARESAEVVPGPERTVLAPFGGAEHDWAAVELSAWIASATGAPLKLLGTADDAEEVDRVSRMLADASLLIQAYAGIGAEPVIAQEGRQGVIEAAAEAGLLVIGLSSRWREEGLGPTRSAIARSAPAPTLFVRRGIRPGALAPADDFTRFTWSAVGTAPGTRPSSASGDPGRTYPPPP
jgi:Kef-type K+ transport system membrane component KefB/nucleotide-binding universal stress UspA family protein